MVDILGARKKAGWRELAFEAGTAEALEIAQGIAEVERAKRSLAARFRKKSEKAEPASNSYVPAKPWDAEIRVEPEEGMGGELTRRQKHLKLLRDHPDLFK